MEVVRFTHLPRVPASAAPSDSQVSGWALPMWLTQSQILPRMVLTWGRNHFNSPRFSCNQQRITVQLSCRLIANIISKLWLCAAHLRWPLIFLVLVAHPWGSHPKCEVIAFRVELMSPFPPPTTHTIWSVWGLFFLDIRVEFILSGFCLHCLWLSGLCWSV